MRRGLASLGVPLLAALLLSAALSTAAPFGAPAFAVTPQERLADPVLEARARAISQTLRCLVCQNESIDESSADLAHDIRVLLRQRLLAGDTDAQAVQYIVARYGQFVLLRTPVEPATYVLWYGPGALLLAAGLSAVIWLRRRPGADAPASVPPLTDAEQQRLDHLLRDTDP
ncbi:MAG TPA: cytochrome c-type biogenesis protein [Acetobacteraceae bacterium]|nr:cytochrome c-type biogenesis protein [Acetobacteraceae bacterium]